MKRIDESLSARAFVKELTAQPSATLDLSNVEISESGEMQPPEPNHFDPDLIYELPTDNFGWVYWVIGMVVIGIVFVPLLLKLSGY